MARYGQSDQTPAPRRIIIFEELLDNHWRARRSGLASL